MFDRVLNTPLGWVINRNKKSVAVSRLFFLSKETREEILPSDQTQPFYIFFEVGILKISQNCRVYFSRKL